MTAPKKPLGNCLILGDQGLHANVAKNAAGVYSAQVEDAKQNPGVLVAGGYMYMRVQDHKRIFFAVISGSSRVTFYYMNKKERRQHLQRLQAMTLDESGGRLMNIIFFGHSAAAE